jgi:hypothetical protein
MGCGRRVRDLAFALLACAACSSSSGGSDVAAFVGTWQYSGATQTETCGTASTTTALTTTIQIQQGTASGTIEYIGAKGCSFTLNVSGDTATPPSGATCTETMGATTAQVSFTGGTATLSGTMITLNLNANATINSGGLTTDCTVVTTGVLTQVSK